MSFARHLECRDSLMQPGYIDGCLAWYHTPARETNADVAIVVCPPVNRDGLRSHHSLRVLADSFAASGYPTLRISYPGTGNSREVAAGEEHWSAWQAHLGTAADWLLAETGRKRLIFAGLRLGATVSTLVSQTRDDVAGLLLMAPVLRGCSYIRQLAIEAELTQGQPVNLDQGLDFLELNLAAASVARMLAVDLRTAELRPGMEVAIFQSTATRMEDGCATAWTAKGARVCRHRFDGLEPMLVQSNFEIVPPLRPQTVLDWLCRTFPQAQPASPQGLELSPPDQRSDFLESPVQFGCAGVLRGILTQPAGTPPVATSARAVIIVNAGRDPHHGIARFGVELARKLATAGIASLRFDFSGVGDSLGPPGQEDVPTRLLQIDRSSEITQAVDVLHSRGFQEIGVYGLCSGAYHAFHAALADPRIGSLVLVNLPAFLLEHLRLLMPPKHYMMRMLDRRTWIRLSRGDIACGSILRAQAARLRDRARAIITRSGPPQRFPHRALRTLADRKVRSLLLFAEGDEGLEVVRQTFGEACQDLTSIDGVVLQVLPGIDHALTGRHMRNTVADLIISFVSKQGGLDAASAKRLPLRLGVEGMQLVLG